MLVALVLVAVVQHMDLEVVAVPEVLDKTEQHLRVVMEVLAFNFHQHLEILPHQLDLPGPAKYFVAGGGGGVSDAAEPTTGQGGGAGGPYAGAGPGSYNPNPGTPGFSAKPNSGSGGGGGGHQQVVQVVPVLS